MNKKQWILLIVGLLGLLALFAACKAPEAVRTAEEGGGGGTPVVLPTKTPLPADVKAVPGGFYRSSYSNDPPYWDANMGTSGETSGLLNRIHMELFQFHYGPQYEYWDLDIDTEHGLVTTWEVSKDALTWTFRLRQGVLWQNKPPMNGREFVANDVKWTLETQMTTAGAPRRTVLSEAIASMECPDKYTLVLHLKEPRADMLMILANPYIPILAPELKTVTGDLNTQKAVVGLGAFTLDDWVPNVRTVYKKNPTYYRANEGLPYMDGLYHVMITDPSTSLAAFRAEKLDSRGISRLDLASVKETNPDIYCHEGEVGLTQAAMAFRSDKPPFNDPRVRAAVSMALNDQEIIDTLYYGYGIVQNGPIHANSPWYLKDQGECDKYNQYNPEEARKLLAEAGYPNGFETTLNYTASWGATWSEYVEYWAESLEKIGIKATIKSSELGAHYVNRLCGYDGMVFTYDWGGATFGPYSWLDGVYLPKGGSHFGCVDDPKMTALIKAEMVEMDPVKRQVILDDLQRYAACQQYYVQWPMAWGVSCQQPWVMNYQGHIVAYHTGRVAEQIWLRDDAPGRGAAYY